LVGRVWFGADALVAVGDVGLLAEEEGAVVGHVAQETVRIARHDLHVLGGDVVGDR
jgi:predicted N-acetyltransferase YhbS